MAANKSKEHARAILEKIGFDPISHLAAVARNPKTPIALQIEAARHILPYAFPKLADLDISVTHEGTIQSNPTVQIALAGVMLDPRARRVLEDALIDADAKRRAEHDAVQTRERLALPEPKQ